MRRFLLLGLIGLGATTSIVHAQQDPQYTQYMYNQNVINPAYAGTEDAIKLTALYRQQWVSVDGAPETITFSGSTPLGERVGLGLSIISDELGPVRDRNFALDFSYRIPVSDRTTLALGIKAGFSFLDIGLNDSFTVQPGDPAFQDSVNETVFNAGIGSFLYSDNWYVGLSMPGILDAVYIEDNDLNYGNDEQHYFLTGGYVFDLNENFKLKPHFLLKGALTSPVSFDINTNLLMYDRFEVGVSYRYQDSFSGLASFLITDNLRLGYAYDRVISDISVVANSSHEVFLSFNFALPRKVMQSPRFF